MASKEINQTIKDSIKRGEKVALAAKKDFRSSSDMLSVALRYALGRRGRMRIVRHTFGFIQQEIEYARKEEIKEEKIKAYGAR